MSHMSLSPRDLTHGHDPQDGRTVHKVNKMGTLADEWGEHNRMEGKNGQRSLLP